MKNIIAIGGGDIRKQETLEIDKKIVSLVGKNNPVVLFIPTASEDSQKYIDSFKMLYEKELHCEVILLLLTKETYLSEEIESLLVKADIIYVGGGNLKKMLKLWNENNLSNLIKEHALGKKILCGLSAGAMCWFEYCFSDSNKYESEDSWDYIIEKGLGFIEGIFVPHFNDEKIRNSIHIIEKIDTFKIFTAEDNTAIQFSGDFLNNSISNLKIRRLNCLSHNKSIL